MKGQPLLFIMTGAWVTSPVATKTNFRHPRTFLIRLVLRLKAKLKYGSSTLLIITSLKRYYPLKCTYDRKSRRDRKSWTDDYVEVFPAFDNQIHFLLITLYFI